MESSQHPKEVRRKAFFKNASLIYETFKEIGRWDNQAKKEVLEG